MAIKHIPDGADFGSSPDHFPPSFGFHGSAHGAPPRVRHGAPAPAPAPGPSPAPGSEPAPEALAFGGAAHLHPHGHDVFSVDHRPDGRVVHQHSHGGHTVHHPDGRITHHNHDFSPVANPHSGIEAMHDSSEYAHRQPGVADDDAGAGDMGGGPGADDGFARGGAVDPDDAQDKAMVEKGVHEHEANMHGSWPRTQLHLARGGGVRGERVRLPRGMKPEPMRRHSPIETPPRNPNLTTTPRNEMAGGEMGYGVEPSAEPDVAGSDQGIPQLRRGGRAKRSEWE